MPLDKSGAFRANPAIARMHDAQQPAENVDPNQQPESGKGHVEIHDHGDGSFHTVHHLPGGQVEEKQHGSHHEAHQAINEQFADDGCSGLSTGEESEGGGDDSGSEY